MHRASLPRLSLLLAVLLPIAVDAAAGGSLRDDASASAAVTASNLHARERFWPYRVALVEAWRPEGREKPLPAGSPGILIRVQSPGLARIDFSAAGKYDVPVDKTDLVQSANRIRRGELAKDAPNFTYAIAARMVDSASDVLKGLPPEASAGRPGFLCVFVDPDGEEFGPLAAALAPLRDRHGVMTILFPQGRHPDAAVRERLRTLGWTVPFLFDFLSEPYTRSLLADGTPMPFLLLQTNEGRVLFEGRFGPEIVPELTAALDRALAPAPVASHEASR